MNTEQISKNFEVDEKTLQSFIENISPRITQYFEENGLKIPTDSSDVNFQNAITWAHEQFQILLMELYEGKTCRAKVTRKYLTAQIWLKANNPNETKEVINNLAIGEVISDEDLLNELGFDNVKNCLVSLIG